MTLPASYQEPRCLRRGAATHYNADMFGKAQPPVGATHSIRDEIHGVLIFLAAIWAVFLISLVFPSLDNLGVEPRTVHGLVGVAMMPFLHADFTHIMGNTVPLLILLMLLAGSRARSWLVVLAIIVLGGLLLWACGRSEKNNIGASGLVFGLIVFLIGSGFLERRIIPMLIALFVVFLYGGALISGILPTAGDHISWDGHLCGAVAGGLVAYVLARPRVRIE